MKQKKKLVKNFDPEIIFEDEKDCDEKTLKQIIEVKNHLAKLDRIEANKKRKMTDHGKRRSINKICDYVEIIRIYFNEGEAFRNWKKLVLYPKGFRDWKSTVTYFNEINKTKIDCNNTFLIFLEIISPDKNPIEIYNYFKDGKSNEEIAKLLKDNFEL